MWNYSDKVLDHFMNPRNVGELEHPDGVGEVGSMACGDALRLAFRLDDDGRIAEARFQTFGCGSAIASSSVLTEMIKGKTLVEAAAITNEDIAAELDGLPRQKMHCSVMGREALEAAMVDHFKRQGKEVPCDLLHQSETLCHCFEVSRDTIREAILAHDLETVEDVTDFTKAGGGCGQCQPEIEDLLRDCAAQLSAGSDPHQPGHSGNLVELGEMAPPPAAVAAAEVVDQIRELLDNEISVALRHDGGDIEFVRYEDGRVYVRLIGSCAACRKSETTIKGYVEPRLREFVSESLRVIEVKK